ncbi:MAG: biotin--[acetyl-CoA-carboxylase] ligase [Geminocystis sp.]|nr:biotin--[acetyl-CoA-carboxylase] ligase [Geminocystis sp.]
MRKEEYWQNIGENGIKVYLYDSLDSTNNQAWRLRQEENKEFPLVVMAKRQLAGKGQRGKRWESREGGLYLSVGLNLNLPVTALSHLTIFSAATIVETFNQQNIPVRIKWLNDLVLEEKKLGGILWETKTENKLITAAVVGVGLNYENTPPPGGISLQSYFYHTIAKEPPPLQFLARQVIYSLIKGYNDYLNSGIESIINTYNKFLFHLDKEVKLGDNRGRILEVDKGGGFTGKNGSKKCTDSSKAISGEVSAQLPKRGRRRL